jgi:hypothetical protein
VVKIFWETRDEKERETYLDQPEDAFAAIAAAQDVEIVEHSEHPAFAPSGAPAGLPAEARSAEAGEMLHDVTIEAAKTVENARVVAVPPEEFGITRHARNIRDADYAFHDVFKSESALIAQGYDRDQVKNLPSYIVAHTVEEIARDTVNESTLRQGEDNLNTANRLIRVTEHYIKMDYEGNDEPRLYRVTTAGEDGEVLLRDGEPDVIEEDHIPFAAMTPVIQTHRFWGRSIADLVKDIQEQKTALIRGMLDNLYLHNNPRVEVSEQHATPETLDDLLVSRPGGIVRTKMPGGIQWQEVPDITQSIYLALQYLDSTREWRTGVSRQGQGVDPNALQNQVATIANQMFNAAQGKVKLIARIFAETGIKDLFTLLHATIRKHATAPATVKLRNQWATVDPRDWKTRDDMTINVGLGTGSKAEQLAHLQLIIGAQKEAVMGGLPIVSAQNLYNSAAELTKLAGHMDADKFFIKPGTPPDPQNPAAAPLPKPPDPKQAEIAAKAQVEQDKIKADAAHQQMKTQADITFQSQKAQIDANLAQSKAALEGHLAEQKFALETRLKELDARLKEQELAHRHEQHAMSMAHMAAQHAAKTVPAQAGNDPAPAGAQ